MLKKEWFFFILFYFCNIELVTINRELPCRLGIKIIKKLVLTLGLSDREGLSREFVRKVAKKGLDKESSERILKMKLIVMASWFKSSLLLFQKEKKK